MDASLAGDAVYTISQAPQVSVDLQVFQIEGARPSA
jgi:hypothetical protein